MKSLKSILLLLALLASRSALLADPVKLSRADASDLFVALSTIGEGMLPANTIAAADNVNALRPHVESFDKGKIAYQRAVRALAKSKADDVDLQADRLTAELEAKAAELVTVDLAPLALTDEEITAAKIKPANLAVIRRWLLKSKK